MLTDPTTPDPWIIEIIAKMSHSERILWHGMGGYVPLYLAERFAESLRVDRHEQVRLKAWKSRPRAA